MICEYQDSERNSLIGSQEDRNTQFYGIVRLPHREENANNNTLGYGVEQAEIQPHGESYTENVVTVDEPSPGQERAFNSEVPPTKEHADIQHQDL